MRCNHTLRTLRFACCATAWRRYAVLGCSPIDDMSRILRSGCLALQPLTTAPRSVLPILALLVKERRCPCGPIGKRDTRACRWALVVELIGFEPMTPGLQSRCSAS